MVLQVSVSSHFWTQGQDQQLAVAGHAGRRWLLQTRQRAGWAGEGRQSQGGAQESSTSDVFLFGTYSSVMCPPSLILSSVPVHVLIHCYSGKVNS